MKNRLTFLFLIIFLTSFTSADSSFTNWKFSTAYIKGIGYQPDTCRRDPSDIIKLNNIYYIFYTKVTKPAPLYPSGYYGTVWYATSTDEGYNWTERSCVIEKGPAGKFDSYAAFTPNIIKGIDGGIYLYYTGVGDNFDNSNYTEKNRTAIGVARLHLNREGLIEKTEKLNNGDPVLLTSPPETGNFDSFRVDDAALLIRDNKYYLYYKGRAFQKTPSQTKMGLAIAPSPAGPFVKQNKGVPVQPEGHEVMIWAQGKGVTSIVSNVGRGLYYAEDGINFSKVTSDFNGKINAPGAFRKELTHHHLTEPPEWGISMIHSADPYLVRWQLQTPDQKNSAVIPISSPEDRASAAGWTKGGTWLDQHKDINKVAQKNKPDLVFLGDSITQSWGGPERNTWKPAQNIWDQYYSDRNAASFGISGDRTQHILWRIDNGNFDNIDPKLIVLMIGTNNMADNSAVEIAEGIEAIVKKLTNKLPSTNILLLGIFPRGQDPDDPYRMKIKNTNYLISELNLMDRVCYLDIGPYFLLPDGKADPDLFGGDFLHLKSAGYKTWAQAIEPVVKALMNEDITVIPKPTKVQIKSGVHRMNSSMPFSDSSINPQAIKAQDYLSNFLQKEDFTYRQDMRNQIVNIVSMGFGPAPQKLPDEAYILDISEQFVNIQASSPAGYFYAVQTLLQLMPHDIYDPDAMLNFPIYLPCLRIEDSPRFKWRGMMLDSSRHFQSVEFVKRFIDLMAVHKLNTFHWHLTDGHGWRIEIKKYPELTNISAWRNQPGYDKGKYGGFYTQDQIRHIVKYAADRNITIVPEIEMPGHSFEVFAAYPDLSCLGTPQEVAYFYSFPCTEQRFPDIPGSDVFCAGNEDTFEFLENVLTEVMQLFPGEYIHIGGDEASKQWWKACNECQARIKAENLKDEHQLQSYFIKRIEKFLNANGRKLIGWDEILEGGLAPNATVMSWRGTQGGIAAAKAKHDVVMSPQKPLYFDHGQSASTNHPPHWPGIETIEEVYAYDPVPSELSASQAKHILGAQANMWTCFTHTDELIELMCYPRACALAEITWSPKDNLDWPDFTRRMKSHYKRLDALNVNYYIEKSFNIASWSPQTINTEPKILRLDITEYLAVPGKYFVTFVYSSGAHGLDITEVKLTLGDKIIARDTHSGFTGWKNKQNTYILDLPSVDKNVKYTIIATVAASGGNDSNGNIFIDVP